MSIVENYPYYEMYGRIRYFLSDRCWNDEKLKIFNQHRISAHELVTYDCGLMKMREVEYGQIETEKTTELQAFAVIIRPWAEPNDLLRHNSFEFCGYDLVEATTSISAITNCGADFEQAICYEALNQYGLIATYHDAVHTQLSLIEKYHDENHAYCEIVEMWRLL